MVLRPTPTYEYIDSTSARGLWTPWRPDSCYASIGTVEPCGVTVQPSMSIDGRRHVPGVAYPSILSVISYIDTTMTNDSQHETEIDRPALVDLTKTLVERPSENPPGDEEDVAAALTDRLAESPVDFDVDVTDALPGRPNVVARAGDPSRGSLLLTGHTDVVPADSEEWTVGPYSPSERDGRIVGRGAVDMKGALAAMLVAAETYLQRADDPGEVILAFVADEEHDGAGTRALVEDGLSVDSAVVGEPTGLDVCIAQKGAVRYRLSIEGESAHSGTPDEGVDAIRAATALLGAFESLDERLRAETKSELMKPETLTVTEIRGGSAPNVVAGEAQLGIDWRFHPGDATPDRFDGEIDRILADTDLPEGVSVDWERTVFARAGAVPDDVDLVETLVGAAGEAGVDCDIVGYEGGTDARFLIHDADVPTVLLGPGAQTQAHTVDESLPVESLYEATLIYRRLLERTFG